MRLSNWSLICIAEPLSMGCNLQLLHNNIIGAKFNQLLSVPFTLKQFIHVLFWNLYSNGEFLYIKQANLLNAKHRMTRSSQELKQTGLQKWGSYSSNSGRVYNCDGWIIAVCWSELSCDGLHREPCTCEETNTSIWCEWGLYPNDIPVLNMSEL